MLELQNICFSAPSDEGRRLILDNVSLQIDEGFTAITVEFSCENDMFNAAGETVLFDGVNGGVQVVAPSYLPGDVSDDGRVNNRDLGMLQQYLSDMDVKIANMNACDVTGDGRVNNRDLGVLQQYLSDMDVELKYGAIAE